MILSIETGCITGQYIYSAHAHTVYVAKYQRILALSVGALVVLVSLPGHPPYYIAAASMVAKTYSNSMMAVLNNRVKPVSNEPEFGAPVWNESVQPIISFSLTGSSDGLAFRRVSGMSGFSSYCISNTSP